MARSPWFFVLQRASCKVQTYPGPWLIRKSYRRYKHHFTTQRILRETTVEPLVCARCNDPRIRKPWASVPRKQRRPLSTVSHSNPDSRGPLDEYDSRVSAAQLRDDEHQRYIVQTLQDLHDMMLGYKAPKVIHPSIESLKPRKRSLFASLFHPRPRQRRTQLPPKLPQGLYMYGDVGSGKTMLMDMFYDTLPHNITSKTRIHFHSFMQDVHKRLHAMKMEHGTDLDAVQYIAADIAEKSSVLCFDEFQCTDVADAMILRGYVCYYQDQNIC